MYQKVCIMLVCGLLMVPQVGRAQEQLTNRDDISLPINAEEAVLGRVTDEIMDQEKANDPVPANAMVPAAESTAAPALAPTAAAEKSPAAAAQACAACPMKKRGPSDLVMMNMMMQKLSRLKGPTVVATYDGGVVVVSGNTMTKYDDGLNVINEVELKKK